MNRTATAARAADPASTPEWTKSAPTITYLHRHERPGAMPIEYGVRRVAAGTVTMPRGRDWPATSHVGGACQLRQVRGDVEGQGGWVAHFLRR